jgi:hypothetical protein
MCCMSASGKSVDTGRCQNVLVPVFLSSTSSSACGAGTWLRPVEKRRGSQLVVETGRTRARRATTAVQHVPELIFLLVLPSLASYPRFLSSSCGALSSRVTPESSARLRMSLTN